MIVSYRVRWFLVIVDFRVTYHVLPTVKIHRTATVDELIWALHNMPKSATSITLGQNLSFYKVLPDESSVHDRDFKAEPINSLKDLDWKTDSRPRVFLVVDQPCHVFFQGEDEHYRTYTNIWKIDETFVMKGVHHLVV
jgi:hypothetical protein